MDFSGQNLRASLIGRVNNAILVRQILVQRASTSSGAPAQCAIQPCQSGYAPQPNLILRESQGRLADTRREEAKSLAVIQVCSVCQQRVASVGSPFATCSAYHPGGARARVPWYGHVRQGFLSRDGQQSSCFESNYQSYRNKLPEYNRVSTAVIDEQ